MINSRIQIEDGPIWDFFKKFGFIYMSGDRRFAAPEKPRDTTSYIEDAGENTDSRTVDDAFDYSAKFLIEAPNQNLVNANSKIKAWNDAVRERTTGSDIKRCKTVTFYDDYKRCKIVGIPELIAEVGEDDYYRRQDNSAMDCVEVTLTIHVSNPALCDFDLLTASIDPNPDDTPPSLKELIDSIGQPNGIAPLDANGKVPLDYLPDEALSSGNEAEQERETLYISSRVEVTDAKDSTTLRSNSNLCSVVYDTASNRLMLQRLIIGSAGDDEITEATVRSVVLQGRYYRKWGDAADWGVVLDDGSVKPKSEVLYIVKDEDEIYLWKGEALVVVGSCDGGQEIDVERITEAEIDAMFSSTSTPG